MDEYELELAEKENIEIINKVLDDYRSTARKSKLALSVIIVVCAIGMYFLLSDVLGGILGYILTIALLGVCCVCVSTLGITFKNAPVSDGKLAYKACIAMETLINIKNGSYAKWGINLIGVEQGKHIDLYNEFIQYYPELASNALKRLSKINIENKDIYNK